MGYRTYIGRMTKEMAKNIRHLSDQELYDSEYNKYPEDDFDDHVYVAAYDISEELHGFGKYTDYSTTGKEWLREFWTNRPEDLDHEFFIADKEFLAHVIDRYKQNIVEYYKDIKDSVEKEFEETGQIKDSAGKVFSFLMGMENEWDSKFGFQSFDLEKGDQVNTSWKFEYAIFELIRIYKTFDWENDILIYYGW